MRIVPVLFLVIFCSLIPARAQAQSSAGAVAPPGAAAERGWELALGPHLIRREHSSESHFGGGVTVARRFGPLSGVFEGGGTRREGHNDWRALAGVRATLAGGDRVTLFGQGLAGTVIRQRSPDWAVLTGLGLDVRVSGSQALRFQLDVPVERSEARTVTGVRASVWFVLFSR